MNLSKPAKLLVAALTVWPILYMFLFMAFVFGSVFWMSAADQAQHSSGPPRAFLLVFAAHFATMLVMFGLIAFYIAYLFKTNRVPQDKKALWAAVLFLGNVFAMPVFFWIYIWPAHWPTDAGPSTSVAAPGSTSA